VAERRLALIIGTSSYSNAGLQQLRSPGKDAQALADVLADAKIGEFETNLLLDQTADALRRAIEQFYQTASMEDLALIHIGCHGVKDDDGNLYFAATDTQLDLLESTGIAASFVSRQMARSRSQRKLLFLDCCFSGAFSPGLMARAGPGVDLKERFTARGQIVLTASSAIEYAFEGELLKGNGVGSVFTSALIDGLKDGSADHDGDGWVSVDELYDHVARSVAETTPNQTPRKWNFDVQGVIRVARSPAGARKRRPSKGTGQIPDAPDPSDGIYQPDPATLAALPPSVDWRPLCPEVYDQGQIGSSIAQAIAGGLEFSRRRQGAEVFTPSRLFIYYVAREAVGTQGDDAGATYREALRAVNRYGAPPEAEWPYLTEKFAQRPPRRVYQEATRHAAIAYKRVRGQPEQVKACLAEGYPVLLGFPVYNSFLSSQVAQTGRVPVPDDNESLVGGHAVMIVGYDDSEEAFIVRNSWGKGWGADGFFFLPYAYTFARGRSEDFWTVRSVW
jgi:uncharacterized caspase-like protein